ncbi:hypothetical protein NLJ89_g12035 [Agrocybe chaxingu]|uniref:Uncharacterized protein n=1 Tax=Agrocybe chaxingu TaxID=84603 RepID=A0A9W8JP00_9AGAR|nr:hypothetical protein NLJ89_g12035 [Agrocybe chaxingu]
MHPRQRVKRGSSLLQALVRRFDHDTTELSAASHNGRGRSKTPKSQFRRSPYSEGRPFGHRTLDNRNRGASTSAVQSTGAVLPASVPTAPAGAITAPSVVPASPAVAEKTSTSIHDVDVEMISLDGTRSKAAPMDTPAPENREVEKDSVSAAETGRANEA